MPVCNASTAGECSVECSKCNAQDTNSTECFLMHRPEEQEDGGKSVRKNAKDHAPVSASVDISEEVVARN